MQSLVLKSERVNLPVISLALAFAVLTVLLETALHLPLKLPGHRAFPGAVALLLFAESFGPLLLVGFGLLVPGLLTFLGAGHPVLLAVWILPAGLLILAGSKRCRGSAWFHIAIGLSFGLLRYLSLLAHPHHAPEILRLGGHLLFGGLAGGAASWAIHVFSRKDDTR
jgi:hypothetical protein